MNNRPQGTKPQKRRALVLSLLVSGAILPVLLGVSLFLSLWVSFSNGGDLGGYGAAPSQHQWWVGPLIVVLFILALAIDVMIGVRMYRRITQRSGMD